MPGVSARPQLLHRAQISELFVQCLSPVGALVPNVEMVWARARAEEAVASQTHRALFTFVAKLCLTPVPPPGLLVADPWHSAASLGALSRRQNYAQKLEGKLQIPLELILYGLK